MKINRNYYLSVHGLLMTLSLFLLQCGGKDTVSTQVDFSNIPDKPIVITTDLPLRVEDGDGDPTTFTTKDIKAPWFLFRYSIKNNSSKTITVANLKFTITGSKNSTPVVYETQLDLTDLGTNVTYLEEITPGKSATRFNTTAFYLQALPKDVDSFSYSVKVDIQGWVGKNDTPEENLKVSRTFTTRF